MLWCDHPTKVISILDWFYNQEGINDQFFAHWAGWAGNY